MSGVPDSTATFADVDGAERPAAFADYLHTISAESEIKRYKQYAFSLLALRPGDHVLDVGCGLGQDAAALAAIVGPNGRAIGLDASNTLLTQARTAFPSVTFVHGDATALPFDDASFDCVRADRVLVHLADPLGAVREMRRVLRPGGMLALTEPDWAGLLIDADREVTRRILDTACDGYAQGWIGRALPRIMRQAGYSEVYVEGVTLLFPDLAVARHLWELDAAAAAAVAKGAVTQRDADAWIADLEARQARGEFFCSLTGIDVMGRKSPA